MATIRTFLVRFRAPTRRGWIATVYVDAACPDAAVAAARAESGVRADAIANRVIVPADESVWTGHPHIAA